MVDSFPPSFNRFPWNRAANFNNHSQIWTGFLVSPYVNHQTVQFQQRSKSAIPNAGSDGQASIWYWMEGHKRKGLGGQWMKASSRTECFETEGVSVFFLSLSSKWRGGLTNPSHCCMLGYCGKASPAVRHRPFHTRHSRAIPPEERGFPPLWHLKISVWYQQRKK